MGSSSLVMTSGGALNTRQTYFPYGAKRVFDGSALPTDYPFTGQKSDDSTGLMFYNARYYDTTLGRFTQADTIVPNVMDPQSWNRYAYALNNPVRYTDPTGHMVKDEDGGGGGGGDGGGGDGGGEPIVVTPETANQYYNPPADTAEPQYPNGKACWPRCNRDDEYEAQTQTASQNIQKAQGKTPTANGKPPGNAFPPMGGDPDNECLDATGPDCAGGISPPRNPPTTGNGCNILAWLFGACGGNRRTSSPTPSIPEWTKTFPSDPSKPPELGWVWRGSGKSGTDKGNWTNPDTGEWIHFDYTHHNQFHLDYNDPNGQRWRVFPDGRWEKK